MDRKFAVAEYIKGDDIRNMRRALNLSRKELAGLACVSVKTVEAWENSEKEITGPIVFLRKMLLEEMILPDRLAIPAQDFPLRLLYYYRYDLCTLIDVDISKRMVKIKNFTDKLQNRAFGRNENPDFYEYEEFIKSRCFPETRDKMKLQLKELGLPFYDPLMIIEKTNGRMAEDDFHIDVIRKGKND